jgi:hypothetical protein
MSIDRELPEGVINANPAGGWEDGETADAATAESDAAASTEIGPDGVNVAPVERSIEGADPDLIGDADLEQGRAADPAVDAAEHVRQEGGV